MRLIFSVITACGLALAAPASAHHSFAMFDNTKMIQLEGVVKSYEWTNPHAHIVVVVPAGGKDPSLAGAWDIEGASTNIMMRQGRGRSGA